MSRTGICVKRAFATSATCLVGLLVVIMVAGCANVGIQVRDFARPGLVPSADMATICIYHPDRTVGSNQVKYYDGSSLIGAIAFRRYLSYQRQPGMLELIAKCEQMSPSTEKFMLRVEAGRTYYICSRASSRKLLIVLAEETAAQAAVQALPPPRGHTRSMKTCNQLDAERSVFMNLRGGISLAILGICVWGMCGCASILSKSQYGVDLGSSPPGASVRVLSMPDAKLVYEGTTPARVTLPAGRGFGEGANYVAHFEKPGFGVQSEVIGRSVDMMFMISILTFNPLAYGIDAATGAMWQLEPSISVTFYPTQ